jgi:hypothetical protein
LQETSSQYTEIQQWSSIETSPLTVLSPPTSENVGIPSSPHEFSMHQISSQTRNSLLVSANTLAETPCQPSATVPTLRFSESLSASSGPVSVASHPGDNCRTVLQQTSLVETVNSVDNVANALPYQDNGNIGLPHNPLNTQNSYTIPPLGDQLIGGMQYYDPRQHPMSGFSSLGDGIPYSFNPHQRPIADFSILENGQPQVLPIQHSFSQENCSSLGDGIPYNFNPHQRPIADFSNLENDQPPVLPIQHSFP